MFLDTIHITAPHPPAMHGGGVAASDVRGAILRGQGGGQAAATRWECHENGDNPVPMNDRDLALALARDPPRIDSLKGDN